MGPYFHIRDELVVQDGLILRGDRLVIPKALRKSLMEDLHASHQGIESTLRRARESMYWPSMNAEIKDYVGKCDLCCRLGPKQAKETLISHDVPDRPWAKIATDLFEFDSKEYLVTVDYFSNFFEIDRLYSTHTLPVIRKLKAHMARYGIPDEIVSDQGSQFTSREFKEFCSSYGIKHTMTSPHYHQANGKAEAAVKQAKRILKVAKASGQDPHIGLLNLRNTPQEGFNTSPAQRLMSRRTKTLLPTSEGLLKPAVVEDAQLKRTMRKERQKKFYNNGARDLPALEKGDQVWMQPVKLGDREWKKATVLREAGIRSYEIETENERVLIRNRRHLKEAKQRTTNGDDHQLDSEDNQPTQELTVIPELAEQQSNEPDAEPVTTSNSATQNSTELEVPSADEGVTRTRSGRTSRRPRYLNDYYSH